MVRFATIALAIICAACSPQPDAQATPATESARTGENLPAVHPESGLQIIPLSIAANGEEIGFRVELADTAQAQMKGLMFRTELGDFEGMIFPSEIPQVRSFWMKNTPLPLDIIFIGEDNRILNIHAMTTPYSTESYYSEGRAAAVLELRGGRSAELGIEPGDLVRWQS